MVYEHLLYEKPPREHCQCRRGGSKFVKSFALRQNDINFQHDVCITYLSEVYAIGDDQDKIPIYRQIVPPLKQCRYAYRCTFVNMIMFHTLIYRFHDIPAGAFLVDCIFCLCTGNQATQEYINARLPCLQITYAFVRLCSHNATLMPYSQLSHVITHLTSASFEMCMTLWSSGQQPDRQH